MPEHDIHVVVVAYGPAARTKRAARRARRLAGLDGSVTVVPASPHAARACRNLPVPVAEPGTAAIRDALSNSSAEFAVLIHDDVFISQAAIEVLVAAVGDTHPYVVPYTNDLTMDHFGGSLPPADKVDDATLASRARELVEQPVRRIRPVCIAARRSDLLDLAERPLVEPNLRIDDVDLGFVAAPVLAAHDGACTSRLGTPKAADDKPLLVAAMIVRDEEATLPDLLASIEPLVDRIEICDTGSVDNTVAVAEGAGARVIHREWRDDFGWARNQVLEQCKDAAYVLFVDADDRVRCSNPDQLRRYLATYEAEYEAFEVLVESPDAGVGSSIRSVRIVRGDAVEFKGAVHELPYFKDNPEVMVRGHVLDLMTIEHIGYLPEIAATKNKVDRNLSISQTQYNENQSFKTAMEYARSMIGAGGDKSRIIELLREAKDHSASASPATRAYVAGVLSGVLVDSGEPAEALTLAREALALVPADDMAAAAAARATESLDAPEDLLEIERGIGGSGSVRPIFDAESDRRYYDEALVVAHARVGELDEARDRLVTLLDIDGSFGRWEHLLDAVSSYSRVSDWLVPVIESFDEVAYLPWLRAKLSPEETAEFCAQFVGVGGRSAEVAVLGVVNGLVASRPDLVCDIAAHMKGFAPAQIQHLATAAAKRGFDDAAVALEAAAS